MNDLAKKSLKPESEIIATWSKVEKEIIELNAHKKFCDYENPDMQDAAAEFLAFAKNIGLNDPIPKTEMDFLLEFIIEYFPDFSKEEVIHAIRLVIARVFDDLEAEHFQKFNVKYISPSLKKYKSLRSPVIVKYWEKHAVWIREKAIKEVPPPSAEDLKIYYADFCRKMFDKYKEDGMFFDIGAKGFGFLVENKVFDPEKYRPLVKTAPVNAMNHLSTRKRKIMKLGEILPDSEHVQILKHYFKELVENKIELLAEINKALGTHYIIKSPETEKK